MTMVRWGQRHFPATVSPSVELLSLVAEDKRRKIREKKTLPSLVDAANECLREYAEKLRYFEDIRLRVRRGPPAPNTVRNRYSLVLISSCTPAAKR